MADELSTLERIRKEIRRITKSPSVSQITNDNIDEYINSFILYDIPSSLKLFTLEKNLTFFTSANQFLYETTTDDVDDPLYNFKNKYVNITSPVYIAGTRAMLTKSQDEFYSYGLKQEFTEEVGTGDGATSTFSGTLSKYPVLCDRVMFTYLNTDGDSVVIQGDGDDGLIDPFAITGYGGDFNCKTGAYSLALSSVPGVGEAITASTVPYTPTKPTCVLFHNNKFRVWPIPDKSYRVEVSAVQRPSELLSDDSEPELSAWWEYIVLGACRKIFLSRLDLDSIQRIEAEFIHWEDLINRRTIENQTDQKVYTIYDTDSGDEYNDYFWTYRG